MQTLLNLLQRNLDFQLINLPKQYNSIRHFATRIMALFGSIYVCEQLFSFMKAKTTQRDRLADHHLSPFIRVGTAKSFHPEIEKLLDKKRCQVSGQNILRE